MLINREIESSSSLTNISSKFIILLLSFGGWLWAQSQNCNSYSFHVTCNQQEAQFYRYCLLILLISHEECIADSPYHSSKM